MPAPKNHPPYNKNGEGGRPQKYTKAFIEKEADAFEKWMEKPESIYFKKFALERGYNPNLLAIWAKENERFSGVYERVKIWQENKLVEGGLLQTYNPGFTKFVMGNVCGWADKQESKISGDSANPLAFIMNSVDGGTKKLVDEDE